MKTHIFFVLVLGITITFARAQSQEPAIGQTQVGILKELSDKYATDYIFNKQLAIQKALAEGLPLLIDQKDGSFAYLDGITELGQLLYVSTTNVEAAQSTRADKIQAGGAMGLYLTGKNMKVGVWEVGPPNLNHQEITGRIQQMDGGSSNPGEVANHATHVNGTIMASGVNPLAKGMAFEATSDSYTADNDNSEMANASGNGLIISNHSYGFIRGWNNGAWNGNATVSSTEDYLFGFYDSEARAWDQISYNAPNYLIFKSAGNERNNTGTQSGITPADGNGGTGYDCIGHEGNSKNVMTVGAVTPVVNYTGPESVIMSSFSSWGPTDDGRIKPDLVANGTGVLSSAGANNDSYQTLQGTSMSSPNAAGSLLLIQELNRNLNGKFMRSATLKGLAIHTCREAGDAPGPDYRFGWGLLNVESIANVMVKRDNQKYFIDELRLNNSQTFERTFTSDGTAPIIATICWTDVAGTPVAASLDPTNLMLVNDLDMRIIAPDGTTTSFPWRLDPILPSTDNPNAPATQGDNFRDNVEKIEINNPLAGTYTLKITHKGTLVNDGQDFALILTTKSILNQRRTLYWIGGTGNWNDSNKWSLSSGGIVANVIPTAEDVVIFDKLSFATTDQTVTLTTDANCYTLGWYADKATKMNFDGKILSITNSLYSENANLSFVSPPTIKLIGSDIKFNSIIIQNPNFANANIWIDAADTTKIFDFRHPLTVSSLQLSGGSINLNGHQLTAEEFYTNSTKNKKLNFANITIEGLKRFTLGGSNNFVANNNSILKFKNTTDNILETAIAWDRIETVGGKLKVMGANNFKDAIIGGTLELQNNNSFQNMTLSAGASLQFAGATTQTITGKLIFNSTTDSPIQLATLSGTNAIIASNIERRFCFNHLQINKVNTSGNTKFVAGANSTVNNSIGWINNNCENILFADFNFKFSCAGGITEFTDISTNNPTQFNWNFNLASGNTFTSTLQNPFHTYPSAGDYEVKLTVSKTNDSDSFTKIVKVIQATNISKPTIIYEDDILRSTVVAQNYQWYRDNQPISGAIQFFYDTKDPGGYFIEISNNDCKFRSDVFVITALEEELLKDTKVFPNPSSENLQLSIQNSVQGDIEILVTDVLGKELIKLKDIKSNYSFEKQIDIHKLPKGVFILNIKLNQTVFSKKVIKI